MYINSIKFNNTLRMYVLFKTMQSSMIIRRQKVGNVSEFHKRASSIFQPMQV